MDPNGNMWSFGSNSYGQLGLGDFDDRSTPCPIQKVPKIVQISCGFQYSLILDRDGCVWSFGWNDFGQLGHSDQSERNIPEMIPGLDDIVQILAAGNSSILRNVEQQVFVFGENSVFQLAMEPQENILSPVEQKLWRGMIIIPGGYHNLTVDEEGYLSFFGYCGNILGEMHGDVQIELRKMIPTKNARNIVS